MGEVFSFALLCILRAQYLPLPFSTYFLSGIGLCSVPHSVLALDLTYLENTVPSVDFLTSLLTLSFLCTYTKAVQT